MGLLEWDKGGVQVRAFFVCNPFHHLPYLVEIKKMNLEKKAIRLSMFLNKKHRFNPFGSSGVQQESAINATTRKYFSDLIENQELAKEKSPQVDLRAKSRKVLEISFAVTLALFIAIFQIARQNAFRVAIVDKVDVQIEVADIPVTQQHRLPPPPARPSVPVPTEEESIPEDLTIASTELNLTDIPPPPMMPEEAPEIFVVYDEPPQIIGGMAELLKHLRYPALARAAEIEGIVFVKVLVGPNGKAERTEIMKAKPEKMGFEESAMEALKRVNWKPAKQRDRNIRVWVSIPVQFKLIT